MDDTGRLLLHDDTAGGGRDGGAAGGRLRIRRDRSRGDVVHHGTRTPRASGTHINSRDTHEHSTEGGQGVKGEIIIKEGMKVKKVKIELEE